ncbi:MAG TPA: phosphoribosylformylglycinamidine cyclo-ligase, partial [Clostridia bacterium]
IEKIVKGVSDGCQMAGCALLGGETAEMPGFYPEDEYDLAGFAVGIVDRDKIIDGSSIKEGDKIIGLASSGVHSNGFSLVRRIISMNNLALDSYNDELGAVPGETLLEPTRIYVKSIQSALKKYEIKGIANITGGGFIENIPRIIPEGLRAVINKGTWPVLPVFDFIKKFGNVSEAEMFNTFNMGIGMVIIADSEVSGELTAYLNEIGEKAYLIGEIEKGEGQIHIC